MDRVHVTTHCYPITKTLFLTSGQPAKANGRWCDHKHGQIDVFKQGITPDHARPGQHPVVVTERLLDQCHTLRDRSLGCERWVRWHPVSIIDIDMPRAKQRCEVLAQGGHARTRSACNVNPQFFLHECTPKIVAARYTIAVRISQGDRHLDSRAVRLGRSACLLALQRRLRSPSTSRHPRKSNHG